MSDRRYTLVNADCRDAMRGLDPCSVDSIVTDPPYGLSFMGKDWDHGVPGVAFWTEALRVAKPGAHLLAFGGTRTFHRLACAIEDAGWEIRDTVMYVYGSGFPKSLDVSKAIDKAAGAEREVVGQHNAPAKSIYSQGERDLPQDVAITAPATPAARQWSGWGTALKPAFEPVILARKPLDSTVAANVLKWGTGAVNVDGSRVPTDPSVDDPRLGGNGTWGTKNAAKNVYAGGYAGERVGSSPLGRWPANFIHDGSDEAVAGMGDAARYFYSAKASKRDRDEGLEGMDAKPRGLREDGRFNSGGRTLVDGEWVETHSQPQAKRNHHPTVKPTALMRYLCRLVTPPGGVVLDPFMGSGSTGKAAMLEGFRFIGIDLSAEYVEIARARIAHAAASESLGLFEGATA